MKPPFSTRIVKLDKGAESLLPLIRQKAQSHYNSPQFNVNLAWDASIKSGGLTATVRHFGYGVYQIMGMAPKQMSIGLLEDAVVFIGMTAIYLIDKTGNRRTRPFDEEIHAQIARKVAQALKSPELVALYLKGRGAVVQYAHINGSPAYLFKTSDKALSQVFAGRNGFYEVHAFAYSGLESADESEQANGISTRLRIDRPETNGENGHSSVEFKGFYSYALTAEITGGSDARLGVITASKTMRYEATKKFVYEIGNDLERYVASSTRPMNVLANDGLIELGTVNLIGGENQLGPEGIFNNGVIAQNTLGGLTVLLYANGATRVQLNGAEPHPPFGDTSAYPMIDQPSFDKAVSDYISKNGVPPTGSNLRFIREGAATQMAYNVAGLGILGVNQGTHLSAEGTAQYSKSYIDENTPFMSTRLEEGDFSNFLHYWRGATLAAAVIYDALKDSAYFMVMDAGERTVYGPQNPARTGEQHEAIIQSIDSGDMRVVL